MKKLILSAVIFASFQVSAVQVTVAPTALSIMSSVCVTGTCVGKNAEVQRLKEDLEVAVASKGEQMTDEIRGMIAGIRASKADYVAAFLSQGVSAEVAEATATRIVEASDTELLALLLEIANEELAKTK